MKYTNKVLALLLITAMLISFAGCAECISTEYKNVEVTIVEEYHRDTWRQIVRVGKVATVITHPAVWQITVRYGDANYTINDRDTYNKYKEKIGETVVGRLEIRTYDNGETVCNIISLER